MKRALIVLAVLLLPALAQAQQTTPAPVLLAGFGTTPDTVTAFPAAICDDPSKLTTVNINLSAGTGNTEIVALSGSTQIYICSFVLIVGGADGTQIIYGTGSACATGETDVATFNFAAAGDGVAMANAQPIFHLPAGKAGCVERTNSVTLSGFWTYVQQN